jgi:hypothetical protein
MCDYSLHTVASGPAKVGDKLVKTMFESLTRGFAAAFADRKADRPRRRTLQTRARPTPPAAPVRTASKT